MEALHLVLAVARHPHPHRPCLSRRQASDWPDTRSGGERQPSDGIMLRHDEDILKGAAMIAGPSCPLHLGLLDSPDYWTDDALISALRPLNAEELHHLAIGSQQQKKREESCRHLD